MAIIIEKAEGVSWPPASDIKRIQLETEYELMLLSSYSFNSTLVTKSGLARKVNLEPIVPIAALVSEINADLLFGEFPRFKSESDKAQAQLDAYMKEHTELASDFLEAATYNSAMGTVFLYIFKDEGELFHKFIKSNQVVWEEDIRGLRSVAITETLASNDKQKWVKYAVQLHELKTTNKRAKDVNANRTHVITNYEIKVSQTGDKPIIDLKEISTVKTGLNFIPIKKIENIKLMNITVGKSDYQGKTQLFAEIDARIDQINYCLQENQDPWIVVPPGILGPDGSFNRSNGKMIERAATNQGGANQVEVISWDPELEAAFRQIETMLYMVFFTSRISSPIAGLDDKGGNVESGRALKWKSINTFSARNRKQLYWTDALTWYFQTMAIMGEPSLSAMVDEKVNVQWRDGLPNDTTELVTSVIRQVQNGLKSRETGIKEINDVSEEIALSEIAKIADDPVQPSKVESLEE
jgi:hypothetical protein